MNREYEDAMVDEDLKANIIKQLAQHRTKSLIVTEICETSGMKWAEAERLVDEIEADYSLEIHSRQKPLLMIIGSTIALGGLILTVFILFGTFSGTIIYVGFVPVPYLGNILFLGLGLGMLIGGTRGVIKLLMD
jgi:hypothetical protein